MAKFTYQEQDPEGLHTLEAIHAAHRFNRWMYEQVAPWMQGEILEIGSGIGNISSHFVEQSSRILLSDIRDSYCEVLRKTFPDSPVRNIDLVHPGFQSVYADLSGRFDSAFALNVVEHIEDDQLALKNLMSLLKPGGRVLILVPAWPFLYNRIDTGLCHFRRYTPRSLRTLFSDAGLMLEKDWMFNALGIPAWFTGGRIQGKKEIEGGQMNAYEKLVPLARVLDKVTFNKIGLSAIAVGRKAMV
ncbi:MAG: methyltransferase [Bacteroidia bacterium]|nr:methyltransferase [Bacteroidia bacterium]